MDQARATMVDGPPSSRPDDEVPTPRWVSVAGVLVILLALAFVAMHLASGDVPRH